MNPSGLDLYGSATWEADGRGYLDLQRLADVPVSHFLFTRCDEILRLHADPAVGYAGAVHYLAGGTLVRPSSCVLLRVLYRHGGHAPYRLNNMLYHLDSCQRDLQDPNKTAILSQIVPHKRLRAIQRLATLASKNKAHLRDRPFVNQKGQVVGPGLVVTTRTSFGGDSFSTGAQGWTINGHDVLEVACSVPRQAFMWHINIRHPWRGIIDAIEIKQAGSITPLVEKPLLRAVQYRRVAGTHFHVLCKVASYCGLFALMKLRCLSRASYAAAELSVGVAAGSVPSQVSSTEYCFLQRHCLKRPRSLTTCCLLPSVSERARLVSTRPVAKVSLQALLHLDSEPADYAADLISRLHLNICIEPPPPEEQEAQVSPSPTSHLRLKLVLANQCRWASNPGLPVYLRSLYRNDVLQIFAEYRGKPPLLTQMINWMEAFTCTMTVS